MAEVKIIDIDGVQWTIKDQTARNKITDIEKNISSEDLPNPKISLNSGYSSEAFAIDAHYKVGKIHFARLHFINIAGESIGTNAIANIFQTDMIPKKQTMFLMIDSRSRTILCGELEKDGRITIWKSPGVTQGSNDIYGELIFAEP